MNRVYFVSGIDTDSGKTIGTGLMARYLLRRGVKTITVKLIQTGNPPGYSEDRARHRLLMGAGMFPEDAAGWTAPQIFRFPSSPHLAAALEGRTVDLDAMRNAVRRVSEHYEITLVEGAGGLAVPLTEDLLTVDLARAEGWTPILMTTCKLGSLNHAVLSIEALCARNMRLAGVLYNEFPDAPPEIRSDTRRMIERCLRLHGQPDTVVSIPEIDVDAPPELDFSAIFGR